MARTPNNPRIAYGLDLEEGRGCVVRLMTGRSGMQCSTVYDSNQPGTVPLATLAAKITAEVDSGQALCAGCLPVRDSLVRTLGVPFPSLSKARKVLPSSLDVELPFPLEDCVYDFPLIERNPDRRVTALAAAARNEALDRRLEAYANAGFEPTHLDHEGLALWDEAADCREQFEGRILLLHLADNRCVVVVSDDHGLSGIHGIRIGLKELTDQPASRDRLIVRLRRLLQAYGSSDEQVDLTGLIWSGPGAQLEQVRALLEKALTDGTTCKTLRLEKPSDALARALARRALEPSTLPCSFLAGKREHPALVRRRARSDRRAAIQASVAGLLLILLGTGWVHLLDRREQALHQQLTQAAQTVIGQDGVVSKGQELLLAERAISARRLQEQPLRNLLAADVSIQLAELLQLADTNGFRLESLQVQRDFTSATGSSPDWDLCEVLSTYLEDRGFETQLKRQDAGADELVHFTLQGGLDHAP